MGLAGTLAEDTALALHTHSRRLTQEGSRALLSLAV